MPLPLFDAPPPKRNGIDSPEYFVWWIGFRQGADGQSESYRYDDDDDLDARYHDGHRVGRLFRPLPCMKEKR